MVKAITIKSDYSSKDNVNLPSSTAVSRIILNTRRVDVTREEKKLLNAISQVIFDKKGVNILALDVREISTMTDYCIIAEGSVARHLKALSNSIREKMAELHYPLYRTEGEDSSWVIMDYYDIVIHLLTPDMREKYALEELWKQGKIVDVHIVVPSEKNT